MDSQQTMKRKGIVMNVEGKQDGIAHNVLTIKMTPKQRIYGCAIPRLVEMFLLKYGSLPYTIDNKIQQCQLSDIKIYCFTSTNSAIFAISPQIL